MIGLETATQTDPGRERPVNEDRVWAQVYSPSEGDPVGLFIVCDGIGGHLGGQVASHWAVEAVKHELADMFCPPDPRETVLLPKEELEASLLGVELDQQSTIRNVEKRVIKAVQKANKVVYDYSQQKPYQAAGAGTTITMAVVLGNQAIIANVGDSRAYQLRDGRLRKITEDHSLVASLVASGQIEPEEIFVHPQRNLIYRSLGNKQAVQVDTFWEVVQAGDFLLFCTDGLWEMVQDEKVIVDLIINADSLDQACDALIKAANVAGGEDNIGVVLVKVD